MTVTYESAHKRYLDAREDCHRLESEMAVARAKMNAAERECSVEWLKLLDDARQRSVAPTKCGEGA